MNSPFLTQIDFWDVGQGDASVIHFNDGSVILVDTGLRGSPLVDWLADRPRVIRAIVLTHNDADHAGALCALVRDHSVRIGGIHMLRDRPVRDPVFQKLFRCAYEGESKGHYKIEELRTGVVLWRSGDGLTELSVEHPSFSESVMAANPNASSAMLVLKQQGQWLAIWPGDMPLATLAGKAGGRNPVVMTGPHHGAPEGYKKKPESVQHVKAISPARAFISVGTTNGYSHPRARYLKLLARQSCHVVCSQITRVCDPESTKSKRPVFNGTAMLGLRAPRGGVACRGSWRVLFQGGALIPDSYDASHREKLKGLRRPQCLNKVCD